MNTQNNSAKFAFFYMLSLVSLIFLSLSTGIIIFQIINKKIVDAINIYRGQYSPESLKFAISAIIISAPVYYFAVSRVNKALFEGILERTSEIRKWLTYFILLISSVVMAGWIVATIYNFLDGELTLKFILKSVAAVAIAVAVFSYYFYDIKREEVANKKDKVIRIYFYSSLAIVTVTLISAFVFVESPRETRDRKQDDNVISQLSQIDGAMGTYYADQKKMPENLNELIDKVEYINKEIISDASTGEQFEYRLLTEEKAYELCAVFKISNKDYKEKYGYDYYSKEWLHDAGRQCFERRVHETGEKGAVVPPIY